MKETLSFYLPLINYYSHLPYLFSILFRLTLMPRHFEKKALILKILSLVNQWSVQT